MLSNRNMLRWVMLLTVFPCTLVNADDPRLKLRTPDDTMLQNTSRNQREFRTPVDFDQSTEASEHPAIYGELTLSGPRGIETPKAAKFGRYCKNGFLRSGFSNCIGRFAKPSTDSAHQVGYIGGGTWFGGESRRAHEGTFGMDYSGNWLSRLTWMRWSHGDRYQAGEGRYETEGPRLFPE